MQILVGLYIIFSGICYTKAHFALDIAKESQASKRCRFHGKTRCPTSAPYYDVVISTNSTYHYVQTTGCPPYENPGWTNPMQACVSDTTYEIPINPKVANVPIPVGEILTVYNGITYLKEDPAPILGALGVLINGVRIFGVGSPCGFGSDCPTDGGPSKWVDAVESEGHTTDSCGGHAAPGSGQYHVHSGIGFDTNAERQNCDLPQDVDGQHSERLGWMFDGYGMYGRLSLGGELPTDLDECGGHTHLLNGVTTYHYHMPDAFPWIVGCLRGCPEVSNNPNEFEFVTNNAEYGC